MTATAGRVVTAPTVVAAGLTFPTGLAFDAEDRVYIAESGMPFGGAPPRGRIWRLDNVPRRTLVADGLTPPVTGLCWHEGRLYVAEGGGRISRVDPGTGRATPIVRGPLGPAGYATTTAVIGTGLGFLPDGRLLALANKFAVVPAHAPRFAGQLVVALFGDGTPTRRLLRVDPVDWTTHRLPTGLPPHRPIDVAFAADGALYVLDFGEFERSGHGVRARAETGCLWRCADWAG
jgi:sugar lactone lactonase YvrE